jgi:anti-anti-sigma regulatory factor
MWKMQKVEDSGSIVWRISGRIEAEGLVELEKIVSCEEAASESMVLDLQDVRLVDQQVVRFLAACEANGAHLRNCPAYIREWIQSEKGTHRSGE